MSTPVNFRSPVMDPLLTYKFVVSWEIDGMSRPVAGVSKVGPLARTTAVAEYGNAPGPVIPGQTTYDEIQLERGVILDVAFERWANKLWYYEASGALGAEASLADFRKTLTILHCNQAGQAVERYYVFNCWPSKYSASPELDAAAGNAVALESLTLQNEGWQRDASFTPADLPAFALPAAPIEPMPPG